MRLDFSNERVLAVVAHPDDAELLCAGTLARAKRDGAAIGICVLCQGDKGQPATTIHNLAAVRCDEMTAAAQLLGAELLLGHIPDGELADIPEQRTVVVDLLRRFGPSLVLGHNAHDYHPDHRAASALAEAATWFAASQGVQTGQSPLAAQPALWWLDSVNMVGFQPGFYLDICPFVELKHAMLSCHRSQRLRAEDPAFSQLDELMTLQYHARGAQAGVQAAEAFRIHDAWKRIRAW